MDNILKTSTVLIPYLILGAVLFLTMPITFYWARFKNRHRKSPLSAKLLRLPGETLRDQIDDLNTDIIFFVFAPGYVILMCLSSWLTGTYFKIYNNQVPLFLLFSVAILSIYFIHKAVILMIKRNQLRVGLEAERAVGEELNRLCSYGCLVYHDFPAENFDIDHVLISKKGSFAVETKGRSKLKFKKKNWIVQYVNDRLVFPDREERQPIIQARRQAKWLATFLSKKLRKQVEVTPVLAIPGWFVEIKQRPQNLIITSGNKLDFILTGKDKIDENVFLTVAAIIEDRCRNVNQFSFPKIAN